jgi:hypothetical protein
MEHVLLPWLEFVPMGQDEHADTPSVSEYLFASQLMQDAVPAAALYFPAAQGVHDPPSGPDEPGLQVQSLKIWLDGGEYEFVGHGAHSRSPAEYLPDAHTSHGPPRGPAEPALQLQSVMTEAPTRDFVL